MATDYSKLTDDELFEALEAAILKTHHASQPGVPVSRQHKENSVWYMIGNEVDARGESVSRPRYLIMLRAEHPALRYAAALALKYSDTELVMPVLREIANGRYGLSANTTIRWMIEQGLTKG